MDGTGSHISTYLIVSIVSTVITIGVFAIYTYVMRQRSLENEQRASMERFRESIERRIYDLDAKLNSNSERWRDVNHLLVDASTREMESEFNKFNRSGGENQRIDEKLIFVLMPLHPDYFYIYETICKVGSKTNMKVERGDEEKVSGPILPYIVNKIEQAKLVIAVIDGRNPNVFYELGLAHALGKKTIMISSNNQDIPFDIKSSRILFYQDIEELQSKLPIAILGSIYAD